MLEIRTYNIVRLETSDKKRSIVNLVHDLPFDLETALTVISVEKLIDVKKGNIRQYFLIEAENLEAFKKHWQPLPMSATDPNPKSIYAINRSEFQKLFATVAGAVGNLLLIPDLLAARALRTIEA